jgi:hypothetical protein
LEVRVADIAQQENPAVIVAFHAIKLAMLDLGALALQMETRKF